MIETQELTRYFGDFCAVDYLKLQVRPGELYGFLGMNGAGKTTTIRMIVGLLKPTSGTATILGHDIQQQPLEAKRRFGYLAQTPYLYDNLTGREFLFFLGGLHHIRPQALQDRSEALLQQLDLTDKADQLIGSYSGGMRRKIALCGTLLHQPDVLILDEPFAGLDPLSARHVKDMLQDFYEAGKSVLMSTHTLEIAERVCTRLGIIKQGQLIAEGTLDGLRKGQTDETLEDLFISLTADQTMTEIVAQL